jgi:hypothetical protein
MVEIQGTVEDKYRVTWNRNEPQLKFSNSVGKQTSGLFLYSERSGFWDYVAIGDSISKKKNTFEINVYREGSFSRKFTLDYGNCTH